MENPRSVNKALGLVSLIVGAVIFMVGLLISGLGLAGLIQGMHGGILVACSMILFGLLIASVGWFCGEYGFNECR